MPDLRSQVSDGRRVYDVCKLSDDVLRRPEPHRQTVPADDHHHVATTLRAASHRGGDLGSALRAHYLAIRSDNDLRGFYGRYDGSPVRRLSDLELRIRHEALRLSSKE